MKDCYSGRSPNIVVKALSIDRDAALLLEQLASSYKNQGQYVSSLIWAEHARREERARLRQLLATDQDPVVGETQERPA